MFLNALCVLLCVVGIAHGQRDSQGTVDDGRLRPDGDDYESGDNNSDDLICPNHPSDRQDEVSAQCDSVIRGLTDIIGSAAAVQGHGASIEVPSEPAATTPNLTTDETENPIINVTTDDGNNSNSSFDGFPRRAPPAAAADPGGNEANNDNNQLCCALKNVDKFRTRCCQQLQVLCKESGGGRGCPSRGSSTVGVEGGHSSFCNNNPMNGTTHGTSDDVGQIFSRAWNWLKRVFSGGSSSSSSN